MASFEISPNENNNVKLSNLNKLRNSTYFQPLINTGWEPNKTKRKKFSYHMNLENPTHSKYDIIYYFILNDYVVPKFDGTRFQIEYILKEIVTLSPQEKRNLCLLILKKITEKYFIQFVNYSFVDRSESALRDEMSRVKSLVEILMNMGPKYFRTLSYVNKLLVGYTDTGIKNEGTKIFYSSKINMYITKIKSMFGPGNLDILNNSSSSSSSSSSSKNSSKIPFNNNPQSTYQLLIKIGLDPTKVNMSGNKTYNGKSLSLAIKQTLLKNRNSKQKILNVQQIQKNLGLSAKHNVENVNDITWKK